MQKFGECFSGDETFMSKAGCGESPVISVCRRSKQEDCHEFQASLGLTESARPCRDTRYNISQKTKQQQQHQKR